MGKSKQFRWSKLMSHMLLEILADEALKGNKQSSIFKPKSFARVTKEISQKFTVERAPDHVENHLKIVKKEWLIITKLRDKSGFGWDDNLKMIIAEKNVYDEEVMAHPNHERYVNKKIEMFDEMKLVVGKDMATGTYAKSFIDIESNECTEVDSNPMEDDAECEVEGKGKRVSSSSIPLSQKRSHRKRARYAEDDQDTTKIAEQIVEVAQALRNLSHNQLNVNALYEEVMKTEGFDEIALANVVDYLVQNEMLAKSFMAKNANLKKIWIQNFISQHGGSI